MPNTLIVEPAGRTWEVRLEGSGPLTHADAQAFAEVIQAAAPLRPPAYPHLERVRPEVSLDELLEWGALTREATELRRRLVELTLDAEAVTTGTRQASCTWRTGTLVRVDIDPVWLAGAARQDVVDRLNSALAARPAASPDLLEVEALIDRNNAAVVTIWEDRDE